MERYIINQYNRKYSNYFSTDVNLYFELHALVIIICSFQKLFDRFGCNNNHLVHKKDVSSKKITNLNPLGIEY